MYLKFGAKTHLAKRGEGKLYGRVTCGARREHSIWGGVP